MLNKKNYERLRERQPLVAEFLYEEALAKLEWCHSKTLQAVISADRFARFDRMCQEHNLFVGADTEVCDLAEMVTNH